MKIIPCLSLDGGGMKGLFTAYFMKYFCQDAGIPGNKLYQYFPMIGGTSIGAISACGYASGLSPDDMIDFFITKGPLIFNPPVSSWQKVKTILYGDETYYKNTELINQLNNVFGDSKMFQLKTSVLITSVQIFYTTTSSGEPDITSFRPVFFSNVNLPGFEGQNYKIKDCVLASAAAPIYFPPVTIEEDKTPNARFIDGGTFLNNTSAGVWGLVNAMYPNSDRICLLSGGTGLGTIGVFDPQPEPAKFIPFYQEYREFLKSKNYTEQQINDLIPDFGNVYLLLDLVSLEITGPQEAIDKQMKLQSLYGSKINNKDLFYYRFQTVFDTSKDTELDSTSSEFLAYMRQAAQEQYAKDKLKIRAFINNCGF